MAIFGSLFAKKRPRKFLRRSLKYFRPYRWKLLGYGVVILVGTALHLVGPWVLGKVVDMAKNHAPFTDILPLFIFFAVSLGLHSLLVLWRHYGIQQIGARLACDIRMQLFEHLQKLSLRFYDERQTGKLVSRITDDGGTLHAVVTGATASMVADIVTIAGVLIVLMAQHKGLALVTYAVLPLFAFNFFWHSRRLEVLSRKHRQQWSKVGGFLHERLASPRLVKAFSREDDEVATFKEGLEKDVRNFNRLTWRASILSVGADAIRSLGSLLVLLYGCYLVYTGAEGFTVGTFVAFYAYLAMLYDPIVRIVDANSLLVQTGTSLERIFAVLDTPAHVPDNERLPALGNLSGRVEFDHVSFAYRAKTSILHDISFTVEPGETVAFVGPSGAGKTTIISLLARFYDPTEGVIRLDGQDISAVNLQSLRRQIGIVMQDNVFFSGTIAENIKYGRPEAVLEDVMGAARMANAHDFIMGFPRGYQSEIGERGVQLSGGQRQRIAIARVILKNPRILIFDEATSALDSESEHAIQEAMQRLLHQRTALVIAHRLATVQNANRIFVMQGGNLIEQGKHIELIEQNGLYKRLHDLQFRQRPE